MQTQSLQRQDLPAAAGGIEEPLLTKFAGSKRDVQPLNPATQMTHIHIETLQRYGKILLPFLYKTGIHIRKSYASLGEYRSDPL